MDKEYITIKEEAILFAKEKMEEAKEVLSDFLPEVSEEMDWFCEELGKELLEIKRQRLDLNESYFHGEECTG